MFLFGGSKKFKTEEIPDLNGKVIFVTGGNVGLGRETCRVLAHHNPAKIYLAARSEAKATKTIAELKALQPDAAIDFISLDLADLAAVQACAKAFLAKETRLDILICNAGVMALPAGLTKDGYEVQFGTNHVGHALLVKLLLPTLVSTAELPGADVRVVAVSSLAHLWCPSAGIAFEELKTEMQGSTTWARYGQSKLANILFAAQLAKRYPKVLAVSVHPGTVDTDLYIPFMGRNRVVGWLNALTKSFHLVSVETGALNQLWAATAGREEVKTGEYYTPVGKMGTRSNFSKDEKLAERLWEWTEKELEGYTL